MSTSNIGWIEPCVLAFEVENDVKNRRVFRAVSREICGQSMEPSEESIVFFGKIQHNRVRDGVVSVASGRIADSNIFDPNEKMFYHWIDFLFVHKDFQYYGYGSIMMQCLEQRLRGELKRPIRVDSAERSTGFYQKLGYHQVGQPSRSANAGCNLFKCLQLMEKFSSCLEV